MSGLILGIVLLALAVLLFLAVLRASRNGNGSGLFSDGWVANVHAPLMVGLLTFGSGYLIQFALIATP